MLRKAATCCSVFSLLCLTCLPPLGGSLGNREALILVFVLWWVWSVSDYKVCPTHASVALLGILSQKPLFLCAS